MTIESDEGEEEMEFVASGSSSGGEYEEDRPDIDFQALDLTKLKIGDYVLVSFKTSIKKIYYVGCIVQLKDKENKEFKLSFLRKSTKKRDSYYYPDVAVTSTVSDEQIKVLLPTATLLGKTNRQQSYHTFGVNKEMIKEKQPNKDKNGTNNSFENIGTPSSSNSEGREEVKKESEKGPEVKEETDEIEVPENPPVAHSSPLDDVKSSPCPVVAVGSVKEEANTSAQSNTCQVSVKGNKTDTTESSTDASSFCNVSDPCENVLHLGIPSDNIHEGVQPLASNVVTKQPVTMDAQYMQQQSQIFVFSTALANKAAEAVYNGQFNSIIAYHCAQPRTKKYLEGSNLPNTVMSNQCNNTMTVDQSNASKNSINSQCNILNTHTNSLMSEGMMPSLGDLNQDMGLTPPQPLAGVKVPDENLTPQQRQHREEQLATLRKMQQILFPEALQNSEDPSSHIENQISDHVDINKATNNQNDWHKLQMQFYDDSKARKPRNSGPPPSYQQATRSASVPIALQSPNPSSPNNTTSNLSLPSPRTCSGINSPADKVSSRIPGPSPTLDSPNPVRNTSSNPPTPVSSHLSPKHKEKINTTNEFSPSSTISAQNSQHSPAESMYCRNVPPMGQQKQPPSAAGKEPNLMPVPSPQQIQYLNAFEGQELTIQKQPNTSLKEPSGRKSPSTLPPTSIDGMIPTSSASSTSELSSKRSDSPSSTTADLPNRNFNTEVSVPDAPVITSSNPSQRKIDPLFCNSPQGSNSNNDRCHMPPMSNNFMQKCSGFIDNQPPKLNSNDKELTGSNYPCIGPDNIPLNPNRISVTAANKSSHFDPISSLAQMSQQLTNNVPNSPVNQPNLMTSMHQNLVSFNSPTSNQHMMSMGEMHHMPTAGPELRMQTQMQPHFAPTRAQCSNSLSPGISVSPKMMQGYGVPPRAMPRGMGYNGANVQVKPNAPNTIQYLPSRPQAAACPRGPPSLDFLQRFSNPLPNLDTKVPTHNLQYFPNNYPPNNMNEMGMCSPHSNIRNPMRPSNPNMMRMQNPQLQSIGFSGPDTFQTSPCQMFGGNPSKGSPNMGGGMGGNMTGNMGGTLGGGMGNSMAGGLGLAPDVSQPLPPSMGQSNNFKNSNFIGPTTADPNYAQQFHNFQQQLYATNTRGQLNTQGMGGNQHYFVPK